MAGSLKTMVSMCIGEGGARVIRWSQGRPGGGGRPVRGAAGILLLVLAGSLVSADLRALAGRLSDDLRGFRGRSSGEPEYHRLTTLQMFGNIPTRVCCEV